MSDVKGGDARTPFPDHRGRATWGERAVPLETFRETAASSGRELTADQSEREVRRFLARAPGAEPVEGPFGRVLVFGGVYSNHRALEALLDRAASGGAEAVYCLGDLGGFGPHPEKVRPLLEQGDVGTIQGNYEESLAAGASDCNCGYTDPRDNHFADLSYRYTEAGCSGEFRSWMGRLPRRRRVAVGARELLLVHGSPRRINEFLFESSTSSAYLDVLLDQHRVDGLLCTHTGIPWHRALDRDRHAVNVGAIGRPANDGATHVWCAWLEHRESGLDVKLEPLPYDHESLAEEMRAEGLPEEFVTTILTGWWTTCLEVLPARERSRSRF